VDSLVRFQDSSGMWHTLLDDPTSYLESSATSGIGYGILKAVHLGILDSSYVTAARRALPPILDLIDGDGIVHQVSYGTPMGRESLDFYRTIPLRPMPYGQATAILLLLESLKDSP
jgi:unsaturated rhamnogalacturonyl hydrolase